MVPSINEIQVQMAKNDNDDDFKRLFLIFSYVIVLSLTTQLEGHYSLWHAPIQSISGHVNWGQFVLDHLIDGINDFGQHGDSYVRGCLLFL